MANPIVNNPNDFKVVSFTNGTDFDFTPTMGCMYDSTPIFGSEGPGIKAGETVRLPYHIGDRLATNLAKASMIRIAPPPHNPLDPNPPTNALWSEERLQEIKSGFITELYTNAAPVAMTETEKLMRQVEELNKLVRDNLPNANGPVTPPVDNDHVEKGAEQFPAADGVTYKDKAEVIAELTKRGISHNPRDTKAKLEQLLA